MEQKITDYAAATNYLNKIYDLINTELFLGELEKVTVTIQPKVGSFGHFSTDKVWVLTDEHQHEINVSAAYLNRPIINIVCTILHEACHLYCFMNGIQDVSGNGVYHNLKFKKVAEEHMLKISKHEKYGWSTTQPSDELISWVEKQCLVDIPVYREEFVMFGIGAGGSDGGTSGGIDGILMPPKKKCSTRKYICPTCNLTVRATKEVYIICGNDMTKMDAED
jgi:hypothetical protein